MPVSGRFNPTFHTFGEAGLEKMKASAIAFAGAVRTQQKPRWLSLLGTSGAGKTLLAKQLWHWFKATPLFASRVEATEIVYPGGFYSWRKTADMILDGDYSRVSELCRETFVVLDDIGAEYKDKNGIVKAKLDRIMDERVGKWTVITCNYSLEQIGNEMDKRIASRMLRDSSQVIDIDVIDYNLRRKAA